VAFLIMMELAGPALLLGELGPVQAMRDSWRVTRRNVAPVLMTLLVSITVHYVVRMLLRRALYGVDSAMLENVTTAVRRVLTMPSILAMAFIYARARPEAVAARSNPGGA
jgi:hypothetical protein